MTRAHKIEGLLMKDLGVFVVDAQKSRYFGKPMHQLSAYQRRKFENMVFFSVIEQGAYQIDYKL